MDRPDYFGGFELAQICAAAVVLVLLVVWQRARWRVGVLAAALVLAVVAPFVVPTPPLLEHVDGSKVLDASAALAAIASLEQARPLRNALAVLGLVAFALVGATWPSGGLTLAAVALAWIAAAAVQGAAPRAASSSAGRAPWWLDLAIFLVATGAAAFASTMVLERYVLSGDEWANTYQADVFGHLHAYGAPRVCSRVFQAWWVLDWQGRSFSQYTPSWPLFMAPFQRLGQAWLAGPTMLGILAVGIARLARRVTPSYPLAASVVAAGVAVGSPALLLNAASRYPHTMVCACFAWMIESICEVTSSPRRPAAWGIALGVSGALLLGTRPLDGGALGFPVAVYFVVVLARRRVSSRAAFATLASFAVVAGFILVVLRLQVGRWFATGYSVSAVIRDLPPAHFSVPNGEETFNSLGVPKLIWWWWPCIPAAATAGIVGFARRLPATALLVSGAVLHTIAYTFESYMRTGEDSGYSPRFHLPLIVLGAVYTAVALVETWRVAKGLAAPALAAATLAFGTWRLGPSIYPTFRVWLHEKHALVRAIEREKPKHAVVLVRDEATAQQPWDATQNLPSDADPEVLIVTDYRAGDDLACARRAFADRAWYEATGKSEVVLKRIEP